MSGLLPDDTFEFTFPADMERPEPERRVLIYRHATARHWLEWSRRAREIGAMPDWPERLAAYEALLLGGLAGTRNLDAADLLGSLMQSEMVIVAESLPGAAMLSEFDRKKSPSPSRSGTAPCAASAEASAAV